MILINNFLSFFNQGPAGPPGPQGEIGLTGTRNENSICLSNICDINLSICRAKGSGRRHRTHWTSRPTGTARFNLKQFPLLDKVLFSYQFYNNYLASFVQVSMDEKEKWVVKVIEI